MRVGSVYVLRGEQEGVGMTYVISIPVSSAPLITEQQELLLTGIIFCACAVMFAFITYKEHEKILTCALLGTFCNRPLVCKRRRVYSFYCVGDCMTRQERCAHAVMCSSVWEYGGCENEDPTYNDPHHCKHDTRFKENPLLKFANFVIDECNSNHHLEESLGRIKAEAMRVKEEVGGK